MWSDEIYEDSLKPLRVCKECGEEAWTYEDLIKFISDKTCMYNRKLLCKKCGNTRLRAKHTPKPIKPTEIYKKCKICGMEAHSEADLVNFSKGRRSICNTCIPIYYYLWRNKDKTIEDYYKSKEKPPYLKKCPKCGLEAHSEDDLYLFARADEGICKKCRLLREKKKKPRGTLVAYAASLRKILSSYSYFLRIDINTPRNISDTDFNKLLSLREQAYYLSKICNKVYELDHIYPRTHPLFCGLTVPDNIQILEKRENMSKGNKIGYIGQSHISELGDLIPSKVTREKVFSLLGSNKTYEEFLVWEKETFKGYIE